MEKLGEKIAGCDVLLQDHAKTISWVHTFYVFTATVLILDIVGLVTSIVVSVKYTDGTTKISLVIFMTVLFVLSLLGAIISIWYRYTT